MCVICKDIIRGKLTSVEDAQRVLAELAPILDPEHIKDAEKLIADFLTPLADHTQG